MSCQTTNRIEGIDTGRDENGRFVAGNKGGPGNPFGRYTAQLRVALLAAITEEAGPMLEPLKDVDYFRRVFVEDGVLTWPNGYDWDPIALHDEMKQAGELRPVGDAAE